MTLYFSAPFLFVFTILTQPPEPSIRHLFTPFLPKLFKRGMETNVGSLPRDGRHFQEKAETEKTKIRSTLGWDSVNIGKAGEGWSSPSPFNDP